MVQILITKPSTLTKADRAKLRTVDVVVVEAADPTEVKLITVEGAELGGSDLFRAAIQAIARTPRDHRAELVREMFYKLLAETVSSK